TDVQLEILGSATDREIQEFYSALQQLAFVHSTELITKEKTYERTRLSDPNLVSFLETYSIENPFKDTIGISLVALSDFDAFAKFVENPRWNAVVDPAFLSQISDQEEHVYSLLSITSAGRLLTIIILAITASALVFITTELVRRRALARSDEVLVERLVGATPLSITLPFITESAVLLWAAIVFSTATLLLLLSVLPAMAPALNANGVLGPLIVEMNPLLSTMFPILLCVEILISPAIACAGAWLGVRPQVRTPCIS
ncbi:MAG: permease-like cell division protein FtsX, partial [Candidatus Peribacteraceae bacterium]|nr:permease-like cell division protein FtsX [Candidatus Peribacteraceae bacterium]